jgi:hypothetical protein
MSKPTAWVDAAELSELGQCNGVRIWAENPTLYAPDSDMPAPSHLAPLYDKAERDAAYESGVQSMARELRRILDGGDCPSSIPPELAGVAALRTERDALISASRELVVAVHTLASHYENSLGALRRDDEAFRKAKGDIEHGLKVAARHNRNGAAEIRK